VTQVDQREDPSPDADRDAAMVSYFATFY